MMFWSEEGTEDVTVTVKDRTVLLNDLSDRFERGQGFSVATLNLDHVVKLARDPVFLKAYSAQTHVTADGNPIVWLSRLAGQDVSLVPGSELIEPLIELAARQGVPVAFFGATRAALETAADELQRRYPALRVVSCHAPAMGFDPQGAAAEEGIAALKASGAGLCFLALGAPKQEIFATRVQAALPQLGLVSIGAGLDFIAGTQQRAPRWMRAMAAEWLWRLMRNPRRLGRRYAACLVALPRLTSKALRARKRIEMQP